MEVLDHFSMGPVPAVFSGPPIPPRSSGPPFDGAVSAPSSVFWTETRPLPRWAPARCYSAGAMSALLWTAEPPNPLSRAHTGYFGLPSLPAPFLDCAAAGADYISSRPDNFLDQPALSRKQKTFIEMFRLDELFQQCVFID